MHLRISRLVSQRVKAVLCVGLIVNLNLMAVGCGQPGLMALTDGVLRLALDADHPISQALRGSDYAGATAVEVNPAEGTFHLVFPDDAREMSGRFVVEGGKPRVTEFLLGLDGRTNTFSFDTLKQITHIGNSLGQTWDRPAEWTAAAASEDNTVEAFKAANAQLIELASQIDATASTQTPGDPDHSGIDPTKVSPSGFPFFPVLAMVLFFPAIVLGMILFVIEIVVVIFLILQII